MAGKPYNRTDAAKKKGKRLLTITVDEKDHDRLQELAKRDSISMAAVVRLLIRRAS